MRILEYLDGPCNTLDLEGEQDPVADGFLEKVSVIEAHSRVQQLNLPVITENLDIVFWGHWRFNSEQKLEMLRITLEEGVYSLPKVSLQLLALLSGAREQSNQELNGLLFIKFNLLIFFVVA